MPEEYDVYDEDEQEIAVKPRKIQVQRPAGGGGIVPWVAVAVTHAKSIRWQTYAVGAVFAGSMIVYMGQWKGSVDVQQAKNPYDRRNTQAFDEGKVLGDVRKSYDEQEDQINAFLREEKQRKALALAQGYRSLATTYVATPGHTCAGDTEVQCLNTFDANRVSVLNQLSERKPVVKSGKANPNLVFSTILAASNETDRVEALRLAKILAKPANTRTSVEQSWLDTDFPILNSGIPVEELRPRPAVLAQLVQKSMEMRGKLLSSSQEEAIKLQRCLALPPEQQEKLGGCK